ncbi:MAG: hypothetical protein R3F59_22310 [Myxococcota bacterium]
MHTRLTSPQIDAAIDRIERAAHRQTLTIPDRRRPTWVHTLRVQAGHFRHDSVRRAGSRALRLLQSYAPDSVVLALALRLPGFEALPTDPSRVDALLGRLESGDPHVPPAARLAHQVYTRIHRQLSHRPVQDLRIDFHDPLGPGADDAEDADAADAATEMALALREQLLCPMVGLRIAPLTRATAQRALRTLDVFVSTLADRAGGAMPDRLVVSVPDVSHEDQISALVQVIGSLEAALRLPRMSIRVEIGLAASGAFDDNGSCRIPTIVSAAIGRCVDVRIEPSSVAEALGTRDPAGARGLRDLARLSLAGSPIPVSYGTSPDLPRSEGVRGAEQAQRYAVVHAAWRSHYDAVLHGLREGFAWGWDTDAGQIPARLAAVGVFYQQHLDEIRHSLEAWARTGARENRNLVDEVRTGVDCGALWAEDLTGTGFDPDDFSSWPADDGA